MIKVKTKVGNIGLCRIPKWLNYKEYLKNIEFESFNKEDILGKLSELDKELEEFVDFKYIAGVDPIEEPLLIINEKWYIDYIDNNNYYKTPKQSFISLIKSQHPEFDSEKEWLVIKLL